MVPSVETGNYCFGEIVSNHSQQALFGQNESYWELIARELRAK